MDLLFILIGAGLAIFVIFVSFKSIGAGIAAKSEINRPVSYTHLTLPTMDHV